MDAAGEFLKLVDSERASNSMRAAAALWFIAQEGSLPGLTTAEICRVIESAGHPKQNVSRLRQQLGTKKKIMSRVPGKSDTWRLLPHVYADLNQQYGPILDKKPEITATDSVLPRSLFVSTRRYIEKVVFQLNASYDAQLFDCTAVMCRRLLETLIIEVYEAAGRASAIKGPDGNFYMFAELLRVFEADPTFTMSRNGLQGMRAFKKLGDLSAHNRRFNARIEDIEPLRDGLRVATEELLHLAKLA